MQLVRDGILESSGVGLFLKFLPQFLMIMILIIVDVQVIFHSVQVN